MKTKSLEEIAYNDSIHISNLVKGRTTSDIYEKTHHKEQNRSKSFLNRYNKINSFMYKLNTEIEKYAFEKTDLDNLTESLHDIRFRKEKGNLRYKTNYGKDSFQLNIIVKEAERNMKTFRNKHYQQTIVMKNKDRISQIDELQEIVKGKYKGSYKINNRLDILDQKLGQISTKQMHYDEIDELSYTLYTLKQNKYLQDKGGKKAQNVINTMEKKLSKAKEYQTINKAVYNGQHKSRIAGHIQTGGHVAKVLPLEVDLVDYKDLEAKEKQRKLKTKKYLVRGIAATIAVGILYLGINAFTNKSENPNTDKMKNTTQVVNYKH